MKRNPAGILLLSILILVITIFNARSDEKSAERTIKAAMCQIIAIDGDREGNFVRIENAIREAKNAGAEIMCFPETVILGWLNTDAHSRAYPIPGKDSDRLCELAKKYKTYLCVGIEEKDGADLYDSAVLIDDNGKILLKHRKINTLPELMNPPYAVGRDINAVDTKFGKIGILICADTFLNENLMKMASLKPDLVLVPYGWAGKEEDWPKHSQDLINVVVSAARTIGAPVIGTDLIGQITKGPWTGLTYGGESIAASRTGKIVAVAADRDRDIKVFSIGIGRSAMKLARAD